MKKSYIALTYFSAVLDFQKKKIGPAGPQVFIFGRQNKYSGSKNYI